MMLALLAHLMVPFDAQHALGVDHVALALYELGFGRIAQLMAPCDVPHAVVVDHLALTLDVRAFARNAQVMVSFDTPHALVVYHVALALDVRVFGRGAARIAVPHFACALEARASLIVPLQHALPVNPRANGTHFVELVKRCVFNKHGWDVVI